MRSRLSKYVSGIALCLLSTLAPVGTAAAAGTVSQNIAITPSSAQFSIAPGESGGSTLTVLNQGDSDFAYTVSTAPYFVKGEDYTPDFTLLPGKVDASQWIHVTAPSVHTLAAKKLVNLDYTIAVPKDTAPGGYYAVIFAETEPTSKTGVVSHNRVGSIMYITVKGQAKTGGAVSAGGLPLISFTGSVPISTRVSNAGGVHFLTTVNTAVTNIVGKQVYASRAERYVLPQTVRKITSTWNDKTPIGLYKIGRNATVDGQLHQLPNRWIVVVQPWLLAAIVVVIVFFLTLGIRKAPKRPNRKR